MNGWRGWGGEDGPDPAKLAFAAGAVLGLIVLGWMMFARSGEESVSSNGFAESSAGGEPSSFFPARSPARTGLSLVSRSDAAAPPSVKTEPVPGPPGASAEASAAPSAPAPAPAEPESETSGAAAPPSPKEMAAAGVPTDAAGLARLGSDGGLLTGAISRLLDHPRILRALLDNKLVVDALMNQEDSKRDCSDAAALQAGLSSPGAGAYESRMMPLVSRALSNPDALAALAGSEMGSRLMACPSVSALARDPSGLMAVAAANPQAVTMVSDPRVAQALSSTALGASLLGGVQSSLNAPR